MDKLTKLLSKISERDRTRILRLMEVSFAKDFEKNIDCKKLRGTDIYLARTGRFRILFHYDEAGDVIIDSVVMREKDTYSDI